MTDQHPTEPTHTLVESIRYMVMLVLFAAIVTAGAAATTAYYTVKSYHDAKHAAKLLEKSVNDGY